MSLEEARKHLELARGQWDRAAVASWEPEDSASCVTNVFYAYENLIVASAEAHNVKWTRNHYGKADLARDLAKKGILSQDLGDELLRLNDLRKDVSYGEPGADLAGEDLEDLVAELERAVDEVETMLFDLENAKLSDDEEEQDTGAKQGGEK